MLRTVFTKLVGVEVPIQLSGMGSVGGPELAAAVSEAGGLGVTTVAGLIPEAVEARLDEIKHHTRKPYGANFLIPLVQPDAVKAAARKARVVDFFWGFPDAELVRLVHKGGVLASWQVGSLEEAVAAEKAGCDFIIAQGIEAGGDSRGKLGVRPRLGHAVHAVKVAAPAVRGSRQAEGPGLGPSRARR